MPRDSTHAFGQPGIPPRWTSSAKVGVGTALNRGSRVWYTLSHGIIDEIYYPRVDQACTRDLGLIVTDGHDFFSEEKRDTAHDVDYPVTGVPFYRLTNRDLSGRYRIEKEVLSDPHRDVVLQRVQFEALEGTLSDYHLYVLLAPHLGNQGSGNTAWIGDYKGVPMLFAQRDDSALALACSAPWLSRSAGFVGFSDGWQDLSRHKVMTWTFERAEDGNTALTGEIDLQASGGAFVLALGFGLSPSEAGHRARASLLDGFESARSQFVDQWQSWLNTVEQRKGALSTKRDLYRISAAVLRTHEAKRFPGGLIASLSIPWGFAKGDNDLGGYHLVWPRDLAEAAGALVAIGATSDACRVLGYLRAAQESDGHWSQNMWLDGTPYWSGIQMDETAFPILLVGLMRLRGVLDKADIAGYWPMIRQAASFIVRNGPVTQQDRWEEDPGYSPFTLAAEVAALVVAATLADDQGESTVAEYLRDTADAWNANIERWTYVTDTDLAKQAKVEGYYVRIAPSQESEAATPKEGYVAIKNRPPGETDEPATEIVSPDALALVRFGLRAPDDPRILNTVKIIDSLLKVDTPFGPAWHRYNDDGYGEHEDGSPFDGSGIGRAWPLLTGERAHYELTVGRPDQAESLLRTMEAFTNEGGLISEQVWDSDDIDERDLHCGRPSGSAMPLVWAHAEYVKLRRSLEDGQVFDMPQACKQRYLDEKHPSPYAIWRFNHKRHQIPAGQVLRIELPAPAVVHWSNDGWQTSHNTETRDTGLGMHVADLLTGDLPAGTLVAFTFYWPAADRWEGTDFSVKLV
jgi:glucoamylase